VDSSVCLDKKNDVSDRSAYHHHSTALFDSTPGIAVSHIEQAEATGTVISAEGVISFIICYYEIMKRFFVNLLPTNDDPKLPELRLSNRTIYYRNGSSLFRSSILYFVPIQVIKDAGLRLVVGGDPASA